MTRGRIIRGIIFWLAFFSLLSFCVWLLDPNGGQPARDPQTITAPARPVRDTLLHA